MIAKKTNKDFELYQEQQAKAGNSWENVNIIRVLFSPDWSKNKKEMENLKKMDLATMAAELGYKTYPWP